MKILFLTIFLMISLNGMGQLSYTPFPDSSALWSICPTLKYYMEGDTIINQNTYKKIFTSEDSIFLKENMEYLFALREDEDKKVYGISKDEQSEKLLYDFSLNIGETALVYPYLESYPIEVFVVSIDSIQLANGDYRNTRIVGSESSDNLFTWIEGIGSTIHLLRPYIDFIYETCDVVLCFEEDGLEIYHPAHPYTDACHYAAGASTHIEAVNVNHNIDISPNPIQASQTLKIEFVEDIGAIELALYSSTGQIKQIHTLDYPYELKVPQLPSGIYYLKIFNENNLYYTYPLRVNN